ncbi:WASH complex subunit 2, partial [Frankliniella fusca]
SLCQKCLLHSCSFALSGYRTPAPSLLAVLLSTRELPAVELGAILVVCAFLSGLCVSRLVAPPKASKRNLFDEVSVVDLTPPPASKRVRRAERETTAAAAAADSAPAPLPSGLPTAPPLAADYIHDIVSA